MSTYPFAPFGEIGPEFEVGGPEICRHGTLMFEADSCDKCVSGPTTEGKNG